MNLKRDDWEINFSTIGHCDRFLSHFKFWNNISIFIWCSIYESVYHVSNQGSNFFQDLRFVNFIFDLNDKSECVAKFCFASMLIVSIFKKVLYTKRKFSGISIFRQHSHSIYGVDNGGCWMKGSSFCRWIPAKKHIGESGGLFKWLTIFRVWLWKFSGISK